MHIQKPLSLIDEIKLEFGIAWRDPFKVTPVQRQKAVSLLESMAAFLPPPVQHDFIASGLRKLNTELEQRYRTKSFDYYEIVVDTLSEHADFYLATYP